MGKDENLGKYKHNDEDEKNMPTRDNVILWKRAISKRVQLLDHHESVTRGTSVKCKF